MGEPSHAEASKADPNLEEIGDMLSNLGYTGDEAADFVRRHIAAKASSSRGNAAAAEAPGGEGGSSQESLAGPLLEHPSEHVVGLEVAFNGDEYLEKYRQMQAMGPGGPYASQIAKTPSSTGSNTPSGLLDLSGLVPRRRLAASAKKRNTA